MNLKAILVDDEENNILNLESLLLKYCPSINVIDKCKDVFEAKNKISTLNPNLVFLDINMPKLSGIELLKDCLANYKNDILVVLVTAYAEYTSEALSLGAFGYLLKPLEISELIEIENRAISHFSLIKNNQIEVEHTLIERNNDRTLLINSETGYVILKLELIVKMEANDNYSKIFYTDGNVYLSSKTLKHYSVLLEKEGFDRVHKGFLVNRIHIIGFGKKENIQQLFLTNNLNALVARTKIRSLRKSLK